MKRLISQEVARKDMADNIKLGPGGIREIEFIAQAFQIVRGGRRPELRTRSLLEVLPLLAGDRQLPDSTVAALAAAYRYLRDRREPHPGIQRRAERTSCRPTPRARAARVLARRAELAGIRGAPARAARRRRGRVRARRVGSEGRARRATTTRSASAWAAGDVAALLAGTTLAGEERAARAAQGSAPRRPLSTHGRSRPAAVVGRHGADARRRWPSVPPR